MSSLTKQTMGTFSQYLSLWVLLSMLAGIALGNIVPTFFHRLADFEVANINLTVAVLIWIMILPMLLKIDYSTLHKVYSHRNAIIVTISINWLVKPFSMAFLAWFFIYHAFSDLLDPTQWDSYYAGLVILAAAPCTAMVFVWSKLSGGDANFTLTQVALNDMLMIIIFAPMVGLLLGIASIHIPWSTLLLSVITYIMIPVGIAYIWRKNLLKNQQLEKNLQQLEPYSMAALLLMIIVLFGFQGKQIVAQPLVILLLAIPIIIQVYFTSSLAYLLNRKLGVAHSVAGPSALIGASNFFELAVATAIALFGFNSGAALATVVGVLVEVPVMLSVVAIVNRSKVWYERG